MQNGEIKGDQLLDEQTRALTGEKSERSYVCIHISAASLCHGCLYLFLISRRKKPSLVFIHSRPNRLRPAVEPCFGLLAMTVTVFIRD